MPEYVTKNLVGVPIFAAGHADNGQTPAFDFTREHLDMLVSNFDNNLGPSNGVSLKVGHTSEAFNTVLAREMGVPIPLLTGEVVEGRIQGAARLGKVDKVYVNEEYDPPVVMADFSSVPEPLVNLMEQGLYNDISPEVRLHVSPDGNLVNVILDNVTVLGASEPAQDDLPVDALSIAEIYSTYSVKSLRSTKVVSTEPETPPETKDDGVLSRMWKHFSRKNVDNDATNSNNNNTGGDEMDIVKLREALGMPDADEETLLARLAELRDSAQSDQTDAEAATEDSDKVTATSPETETAVVDAPAEEALALMSKRIDALENENKELKFKELVATYTTRAAKWVNLTGKPNEIAQEIADLERSAGKDVAEKLVAQYDKLNSQATVVTSVTGSSRLMDNSGNDADKDEFEVLVEQYAKDNSLEYGKALVQVMSNKPTEYAMYRRRVNQREG